MALLKENFIKRYCNYTYNIYEKNIIIEIHIYIIKESKTH